MQTMSKGDFARECNVTPGRVSQWLSDGVIGRDCLDGEGRNARIIVDRAKAQIALRRDPGQAMGNGLGTRLDFGPSEPPTPDEPERPQKRDDVAHQIQLERLEQEKRRNRRETIDEQERLGSLVPAGEVRAQMTRLAQQIDEANGAMLADFAAAIAARFELPQRDVLHELRRVRTDKKAAEAERAKARAQSMPATVELVVAEVVDA
jgi:hypothetical protein